MRFVSAVPLHALATVLLTPTMVLAQPALDRSDPSLAKDLRQVAEPETQAQPAVAVSTGASIDISVGRPVFVGAIVFDGLQVIAPSDFADIVAGRIGRQMSPVDLATFADAVAARMRALGYAFSTASIDAQRVTNGVLRVQIDEGRIDEVRFEGEATPAVRRALAPLQGQEALRFAVVERHLLLAGDIDGTRIENTRFVREADRGVLIVRVSRDPAYARFGLSNAGTKPIGPEQVRIEAGLNGLMASDDSLSLTYSFTPAQPRELQFGYVRYEKRVSASGTELALTGTASLNRPGAYLAPLDIKNRSWYAAVSVLHPLLRSRKASFWLEGEFGVRDLAQWRRDTRVRDDRVVTARMTFYGYSDFAGGRVRVSGTVSQGLDVLGATRAGDPLASRWDADGSFTTLNAWVDWTRKLGARLSLRLAGQGQVSSQPLLVSEEASLGGTVFLRGYDWGERSGDEGIMGMAELRYQLDKPVAGVQRAQLYVFVDGGSVSNQADGFGGGDLASAGGGLRLDVTRRLGVNLEIAAPLLGIRYDTGDKTPKFNFNVVRTF